jgi:hypothetical protein
MLLAFVGFFWFMPIYQSAPQASTISKTSTSSSIDKKSGMTDASAADSSDSRQASKPDPDDASSAPEPDAEADQDSSGDKADASGDAPEQVTAESQDDDKTAEEEKAKEEQDDLLSELQPKLEENLNLYHDSEQYVTLTSTSILTASIHDFDIALRKDSIVAQDLQGAQQAESNVISIHRDLTEQFGLGGGLGSVKSLRSNDMVASFRAHGEIYGLSVEANVAHDPLLANAAQIRANARQTDFALTTSADLKHGLSSNAEFHHKVYSDGNHSNEVAFGPQYAFDVARGKLALGYGFSYMTFARGTNAGYWAPQYFLSHDVSATWSFDWVDNFGLIAMSLGRATGRATSAQPEGPSSGYGYGLTAVYGWRPAKGTILECYFNGTTSAEWSSTTMGLKLTYGN